METSTEGICCPASRQWRKVAFGGMQPGFEDNHTDESFLEAMVTNANVVHRDLFKVMQDSVSISQYLCIVVLVVLVWWHTLNSTIDYNSLMLLDLILLSLGFLTVILTAEDILLHDFLNIAYFVTGLYVLSPIYHTLTRSISSDSIWTLTTLLLLLHLFFHDYTGCTIKIRGAAKNLTLRSNISLNTSIIASVLIASRLPSKDHVFAVVLFSLQVFLFAPLAMHCIKRCSFRLHIWVSVGLMVVTGILIYRLNQCLFGLLVGLLVFVSAVCPYLLIRIQKYKFEINGPWDEAKLCFDITD